MGSPLIGREHEVETLHALLTRAGSGQGQVVGIVGESGIGKSRLVLEFSRRLEGRSVTYLQGRCLSYGSTTPYLPVIELLRHYGSLTETEAPADSLAKLQQCLQAWGVAAEVTPALLHLLGLPSGAEALTALSPAARKTFIVSALTQLCLQASRQQSVVLELENLHWIDAATDAWLNTLVDQMMGASLLLVGTYRPGYRPGWLDKSYVTQMVLQPLTAQENVQVIQAVLPTATPTVPLILSLLAKAEGNPFFLEELARTVGEQEDNTAELSVPASVHDVLSARLDRLPHAAKQLLQTVAVLGREGSVRLVEALWEDAGESAALLQELMRRELLDLRLVQGKWYYVFKHVLMQEIAYASLLPSHRQALHAAAGQALKALYTHQLEEVADRLAYHYVRSGHVDKAAAYAARVAEKAAGS